MLSAQCRQSHHLLYQLQSRSNQCRAYKGFGSTLPKRKGSGNKQAADRALTDAQKPSKARPIDPKEAARGKVDFVQVKDWANGKAADVGDLQVVPGSEGTGWATSGRSAAAAAAAAAAAEQPGQFFQQLAQHAQYLERQGALSIASGRSSKPYLAFESWQYTTQRYMQYLADVAAVHLALEQAVQLALSAPPTAAAAAEVLSGSQQGSISSSAAHTDSTALNPSSSSSSGPAACQVPGRQSFVLQAYSALGCFGQESGLWRGAAAQADLQALQAAAAAAAAAASDSKTTRKAAADGTNASQNAIAYGKYLLQLGRAAAAATAAAATARGKPSSEAMAAEESEGAAAAHKLLAHAYALQVQQQCLGARIGAAATEPLQLLPARAAALYMSYPSSMQEEPVQQLVKVTDAAGDALDAVGRQAVLEELPKALKKSGLLLAPLATAD